MISGINHLDFLTKNNSLNSLNLRLNRISLKSKYAHGLIEDIEGLKQIAKALEKNASLHNFDLSYNNITNEGAQFLAQGLKVNKSINILMLRYNKITSPGAREISDTIGMPDNTITFLEMSGNKIGDAGAISFSKALQSTKALKTFKCRYCDIETEGAEALTTAARLNGIILEI